MKSCHASNIRRSKSIFYAWILAVFCLLDTACTPEQAAVGDAPALTYFPIQIGEQEIQLQLALTQAEQQKGLMFRDSLDADKGMLFLFERPARLSFWMRNTRIPLDIAYFNAKGHLLEIYPLFPFDETPVPSRSDRALIAVETNRGWFTQNNIRPGDQIGMEALIEALAARGKQHGFLDD